LGKESKSLKSGHDRAKVKKKGIRGRKGGEVGHKSGRI